MQLNQFNGGLNTRAAPYLIQQTEGAVYENIDILSGALKPMLDDLDMATTAGKNLYNFNNTWLYSNIDRSYAEFQSALYYTDGVEPKYISSTGNGDIGIAAPTNATAALQEGMYSTSVSQNAYATAFAVNSYGYSKRPNTTSVVLTSYAGDTTTLTATSVGLTDAAFNGTFGTYVLANELYVVLISTNVSYLSANVVLASVFYVDGSFVKNISCGPSTSALTDYDLGTNVFVYITYEGNEKFVNILDSESYETTSSYTSCSVSKSDIICFFNYSTREVIALNLAGDTIVSGTVSSSFTYTAQSKVRISDEVIIVSYTAGVIVYHADILALNLKTLIGAYGNWRMNLNEASSIAVNSTNIFVSMTNLNGAFADTQIMQVYNLSGTLVQSITIATSTYELSHLKVSDTSFSLVRNYTAYYSLLDVVEASVQVTSYNSTLGIESIPTDPIEVGTNLNILMRYYITWAINATNSTHSRIYINRYGTPLLAATITTPTNSASNTPLYSNGTALDSYTNGVPQASMVNLTVYNAMLFGSVGDKLYFSEVAYPHYWSVFSFIDFDDTITGIGSTANGLLVFTLYRTYILIGTDPGSITKYLLNPSQGCIAHKSIQFVNNTLVWVSTDGICASTGGEIQVISKDKIGKLNIASSNILGSIVFDERYYLALSDKILVADFSIGMLVFYTISVQCESIAVYNDDLYYSKASKLYKLNGSTVYKNVHYKSGYLAEGSLSNVKNYKDIYVYSEYSDGATLKVYINSTLVGTYILTAGFNDIKLPQGKQRGYYIEFEIEGKAIINEIEYKVEARQNGK